MGDSDKLQNSGPGSYRFVEHRHYLDLLLERLRIQSDVVMVGSDWGAALAMDWACRNPQRMKGLVYFEAIVAQQHYDEVTADRRDFVQSFKGPEGEKLMLEQNIVVDVLFLEFPTAWSFLIGVFEFFRCLGLSRSFLSL